MKRPAIASETDILRALRAFEKLGVKAHVEFTIGMVRVVPEAPGKAKPIVLTPEVVL